MRDGIMDRARGRWAGILPALGVPEKFVNGKHQPCPMCGGKDRARFIDTNGDGTYICAQCGGGSGLGLLIKMHGWDFKKAAENVEEIIGKVKPPEAKKRDDGERRKREAMNRLWRRGKPLTGDDLVSSYLRRRGIKMREPCADVRLVIGEIVADKDTWHCMLAKLRTPEGLPCQLHRTYITSTGSKAPIEAPRKMMPGSIVKGSAVRLAKISDAGWLGIAEGIETALSATMLFSVPCWAALNEFMLSTWEPPSGVLGVTVFGDNDENYVGQAAAFSLAKRLVRERKLRVEVSIPDEIGTDWNDVLQRGNQ
jgi:putative DNA primase/helicase